MSSANLLIFLQIATISCGLISGFFLTFSDFLMRSLKLANAEAGIEVMQIINREVWKSTTMVLLWSMVALSLFLSVYAYFELTGSMALFTMTGGIVYLLGVFVISFRFNVPMNNQLDRMEKSSVETTNYWEDSYVGPWVFWNYIRALKAGIAAVCFLLASSLVK
ncbi:MAG: DUF1772 domain-containing protein [Arenicella sp.]